MTLDEAKQLMKLFGPCTTMYECRTAEEVLEEHKNDSLLEAAWFEYDLESVHIDRQQSATDNDDEIRELGEFLAELNTRIRETLGDRQ